MTYSIKSKPNFRNWSASGQVRWRNTQKKILPPKKVFFQFNKITFSSLRLQDLGSNFSKFSLGGACPQAPLACPVMVIFSLKVGLLTFCLSYYFFFPVKVKPNPCFVILLHLYCAVPARCSHLFHLL